MNNTDMGIIAGAATTLFAVCAYFVGYFHGKDTQRGSTSNSDNLSALETKVDELAEEEERDIIAVDEADYKPMSLQQAIETEESASIMVKVDDYMLTTHSYAGKISDQSRIDVIFNFFMSRDLYSDDEAKVPILLEKSKKTGMMDLQVFGDYDKETKVFSVDKIKGRIMDEPYEVPVSSMYKEELATQLILDE